MLLVLFKRLFQKATAEKKPETEHNAAPEQQVHSILQGDELLRERFIEDYKPFILKATSRFCKRYVNPQTDDEFSIALVAFNEAINQYSPHAGKSFLGFAETVIRRRLIDYVRKEQKHSSVVAYSAYEQEDEEQQLYNPLETRRALQHYEKAQVSHARRLEIAEYNEVLQQYGITFLELAENSPKHADSRQMLIGISKTLIRNNRLLEQLQATRKLPVKELTELSGVSRKTIERNRKYIIAVVCALTGTYPFLQDYLQAGGGKQQDRREGLEG
ncbi:RNA polymerase sigma factor SigI [Paenibacillus protaetiae]|uniref:RNA polymerase sigma factor SigI n=1 Tax=Paenibacillus protaetiae TaxID=2509456 RepID=A0A4P6EY43_9BACL|nr:RNA polymerase sigma factor SigI [Paenibacillus protaetiae]QAY66689.1 RNA polymerase sigma factor SigI [Paenibacillus protaetiae]